MAKNTVFASPSQSEIPPGYFSRHPNSVRVLQVAPRREFFVTGELSKATHVSEKDRLNGEEVEKVTFRFLADPEDNEKSPIHSFSPDVHLKFLQSPDAKFLNRTYWFDPKTNLLLGKDCGCIPPKYDYRIDYPAPNSVSRELFTFEVPRDALLVVDDPDIGRQIRSEGQTGPDLRPR